jgi:AsmA protein
MRKLFVGIAIFIGVLVAGILVFAATFNVNHYRSTIQSQLERRFGRPVTLGKMHLSIFTPRFRVQDLAIADDPSFSADAPFVKTQQLDVAVKLMPLMHKQVEITSLDLLKPNVNLIRNLNGTWNFASLGHPGGPPTQQEPENPSGNRDKEGNAKATTQGQSNPTPEPQPESKQQLSMEELTIRDGQISVLDQKKSKTPSLYDHIDVTLKDLSPDSPFTLDAAVHMAGSGTQEARLQGKGGPIVSEKPEATPFDGNLNLKQVKLGDLAKFLNSPVLNGTDGVISGDVKLSNNSGKLTAHGTTDIQSAKVQGMELGYPISARYEITNDLNADLVTIHNLALKLGSTPFDIAGTADLKSTPAIIDLYLRAKDISIVEAAKLAAASGIAISQGTTATGSLKADIHANGPANKPALNGNIVGTNLQLSGNGINQPIQVPSINLALRPVTIQSNQFEVNSGATKLLAQIAIHNYSTPGATVYAAVRSSNAQLPAIIAMAKAYGVKAAEKVNGAGNINLDMRASGALKSITVADITRAMNGTVNLDLNDVTYSGANISQELSSIAKFLNPSAATQTSNGVTKILKMNGNVVVKNGIAETNNLNAKLDIGNLGAVGTANLTDESLNVRMTAVLTQSLSQKAGGNSVGGFMQTALANNQGELVIPVLVTGTFSQPRFAPDLQQVAQMKVKQFIPNLNNPSSITGALQNLMGGAPASSQDSQQNQQTGQPPQANPQNPVQQILDIFGKKKKSDQQPPK